jgi:hypothetical protein
MRFLASAVPELDNTNTENDQERTNEVEECKLHRIAKVHNFLEMLKGSQSLRATHNESHDQNKQMTAVGYISDLEDIVQAFWSLIQHDGAAAFKLTARSPLPPTLSAKDLPGGLVLATVTDRHFRSGSGSKPKSCQIGGPGSQ